jgi:hypothetical protein
VGVSDLQHPRVDASTLETSRSGGDPCVERRRKGRVKGEIDELKPSVSSSSRWH